MSKSYMKFGTLDFGSWFPVDERNKYLKILNGLTEEQQAAVEAYGECAYHMGKEDYE